MAVVNFWLYSRVIKLNPSASFRYKKKAENYSGDEVKESWLVRRLKCSSSFDANMIKYSKVKQGCIEAFLTINETLRSSMDPVKFVF